jgi:hypothetical protein
VEEKHFPLATKYAVRKETQQQGKISTKGIFLHEENIKYSACRFNMSVK